MKLAIVLNRSNINVKRSLVGISLSVFLLCFSEIALASTDLTFGTIASTITSSFTQIAQLISATSYLAGLGFSIGAIMKFKQHKDNPTQIPIGTPIALLFIAAALLFMPSILGATAWTLFGGTGTVAGPEGFLYGVSS